MNPDRIQDISSRSSSKVSISEKTSLSAPKMVKVAKLSHRLWKIHIWSSESKMSQLKIRFPLLLKEHRKKFLN